MAAKKTPLPPLLSPDRKTIFLDLDDTLVHTRTIHSPAANYDFIVKAPVNGILVDAFVSKRPFVDEFLESLSKKYEIVVFTAAAEEYASSVLDLLDKKGLISHRLYRDSCTAVNENNVKDLSGLGRDMKRVVIVDDNPEAYAFQPENAIPISPFTNDGDDRELKKLIEFFDACDGVEDMRVAVKDFQAKHILNLLLERRGTPETPLVPLLHSSWSNSPNSVLNQVYDNLYGRFTQVMPPIAVRLDYHILLSKDV